MADVATTETPETTGPRVTLWLLRVSTTLLTIAVLLQPVLAGGYLSGRFDLLSWHSANASAVMALALAQTVVTLCFWLGGRGSPLPLLLSVLLFLSAGLQTGMGYSRTLMVHIPLGVAIVLLSLGLTVLAYRRSARVGRPRRVKAVAS